MAGESPDKSEQQQSSGTTRNERDPRLGVFRDPEPGSGDAGSAGTGAGSAGPGEGPTPGDAPGEPGAAPEAAESAESAPKAAGDPETPSEAPETASDAPEGAPDTPEGASAAPEPASDAPEAASDAPEAAEADEPGAGAEPEAAGPEEGDARLRAAVAAWVSTADDGDKSADEAEAPEEPRVTAPREEGPEAEPKAPVADAKEPADDEPATDSDESATTEPAEAQAQPGDEAPEGSTPAAEAEKRATGKNAPDGESPAAEAKKPTTGKSAPDEEPPAAEAPAPAPVDQPTAVFKAPRLPKVDQPTTALKIKRSPSGEPVAAEAESLTERTSQFIPLRSDDVRQAPAPRRPESPVAGQPAALSGAERTRQQPMPPKPPLDLLAELTNTPPPPETPVRTAVRRVKIWTPLVILLLIVFAIAQMVRPLPDPSLTMTAKETYGFEGGAPKLPWPDQGQGYMAATGLGKVDSFGEQKPVPIASVAKAMTAYLVLKSHPLKRGENGPDIKIDAKAEADGKLYTEGESTLNTVKEGDILTERDALAAIMIPSANNIARLLARWEAGSEKAFVAKMNATADELGMKNTTYTDPSGLTASTVSTAEDLVKLGEKLVEFPALMDITKLPEWKDPSGHKWRNYNTLVPYDGALGIKTGSTSKAGGNLLFAAHKMIDGTDQLVVGAILGQYDDVSIIDEVNRVSKKVMVATLDLLQGAKIVKKGDVVGEVDDGMGHTTPVVATKDVKAVGWSGLTVKLELTDDGRTIPHEAVAGTHVGTLTVGEGRSQVKVAVALQSDLAKPSFGDKLTRVG
ncbi:D-alanyl-D-alanine carboxypeptidase [Streptomyces sp. CB02460]|nr:D-alanyl-D-alanine carboxypeptidase [Streptomyces sp. CB02460]